MKTFVLSLFITLASLAGIAQTYVTKANGNWTSASTWQGGIVPPTGTISATSIIKIRHLVTYNSSQDINNNGLIRLEKSNSQVPVLTVPSGIKFTNNSGGKVIINNAEYRQYRFTLMGDNGTPQSGSFENKGVLEIDNSIVEVAEDWINLSGGKRSFAKGKLLLGKKYENKDNSSKDTLDKVSVSLGWHDSGSDFSSSDGLIVFIAAKIQQASSSGKVLITNGEANGDIDYITFKNNLTSNTGSGDLEVKPSVDVTGGLNLDAYCVSAPAKYKSNGKISGSQSADCSLNYFPSGFMVMQTFALSSGLTFINPVLTSGAATNLQVGSTYLFSNVNDTVDAVITVDSLVNGAALQNIDDNTAGTGYSFAFQPRVTSGNVIGKSYAVFSIRFYKTATTTPVSLQYVNASPLDIDGGATLKEFADVSMGAGSSMSYMSVNSDISVAEILPGDFLGQNVLGIERAGIDTSSYINMFTVSNTEISSMTIKYGTSTTVPSTVTRQFSLYMKGFTYPGNLLSLPVKLASFTATLKNTNAELKWTTASEINVSHFVVERSTDGENFSDAGIVFAYGNAADQTDYSFTDNVRAVQSGIIYYRLRSVDIDGKSQYSETRIIRISKTTDNNITIQAYPNPVTSELRVTIPDTWQGKKVTYQMFGNNGYVAIRIETATSSQTETINVSKLVRGFYIMKVTCNGEVAQQKIIKN